jgi:hypothetical protein
VFSELKFDFNPIMFCLAQFTWISKNQIIVKNGTFTCAVNSIIIKLDGITAHAENLKRYQSCPSDSLLQFNAFIQADISKENYCLITPIYTKMGKKPYVVSAGLEKFILVRSDSNSQIER